MHNMLVGMYNMIVLQHRCTLRKNCSVFGKNKVCICNHLCKYRSCTCNYAMYSNCIQDIRWCILPNEVSMQFYFSPMRESIFKSKSRVFFIENYPIIFMDTNSNRIQEGGCAIDSVWVKQKEKPVILSRRGRLLTRFKKEQQMET